MTVATRAPLAQQLIAPSANPAQDLCVPSATACLLGVLFSDALPEEIVVRLKFDRLVQTWRRDTSHLSSAAKTVMHPAYQAIIGLGPRVLPLIFRELAARGGHWLWALKAITEEDPARGSSDFHAAVRAWLTWGRNHGYIA